MTRTTDDKADAIKDPIMTQEREQIARIIREHVPQTCGRNCEAMVTEEGERARELDAADAILALRSGGEGWQPEDGKVYVNVSGLTGAGKSAVYAELTIAMQALGLTVEHADPAAWRGEMGLLSVGGNDLQDFKPTIVLTETNVPRAPSPSTQGEG